MIVAFTGHRPNKLGGYIIPNPVYNWVYAQIKQALIELKPDKVISGMALGVDQWAANAAVELGIPFIAAVPFVGQASAWPTSSENAYNALLAKAEDIVVVSEGGYSAYKMQLRNEWMVDHCDVLIAVWDGTPGGTSNCLVYAEAKGKQLIMIDPRNAK